MKNQYIVGGNCLKGGLGQFLDLRGAWQERREVVDTPMHTMKFDALLHKTCMKVLRLDMRTFMISLSKIAHQIWRDHSFSQRNKPTEWPVGVGVGGNREGGALDKI